MRPSYIKYAVHVIVRGNRATEQLLQNGFLFPIDIIFSDIDLLNQLSTVLYLQ